MAPPTLHLRPSPRRWLAVLAICAAFAMIGVFVPAQGSVFWILNVLCPVFFGLCALVALAQFLPGASGLTIDADGLTARSLWRSHLFAWSDIVGDVRTVEVAGRTMVGFNLAPPVSDGRLAQLNKGAYGIHGALSDTYGLDAQAPAALLNARLRAFRLRS